MAITKLKVIKASEVVSSAKNKSCTKIFKDNSEEVKIKNIIGIEILKNLVYYEIGKKII
jgi:hypothetical protein